MKIRLYISERLEEGKTILLDNKKTHYLKNVLKRVEGDELFLFDAISGEYKCIISKLSKKQTDINIIEKIQDVSDEVNTGLNLAIPMIKPHRMSFLVEKLTELGVQNLIPITTEFTHTKHYKNEKLKLISIEACEQCERQTLPEISEPILLAQLVKQKECKLYFLDERKTKGDLLINKPIDFSKKNIFIIGPEGGFSESEFINFDKYGVEGITLGDLILRAETACISTAVIYNQKFFAKN